MKTLSQQVFRAQMMFMIFTILGQFLLSQNAIAIEPAYRCEIIVKNGEAVYTAGHIRYKPIKWLPTVRNDGLEERYIDFDMNTGEQVEKLRGHFPYADIIKFKQQYQTPEYRKGSFQYTVDHIDKQGKWSQTEHSHSWESLQSISNNLSKMDPSYPFYSVRLEKRIQFAQVYEPKIGLTTFEPPKNERPSDLNRSSAVSYIDYPEVMVFGFASETRFKNPLTNVELLPLGPQSDNMILRVQEYAGPNGLIQIFDSIQANYFYSNETGPLYPGIVKRLLKLVPDPLKYDLVRLAKALNASYMPYGEKTFQRLLLVSGIEFEDLFRIQRELLVEGRNRQRALVKEILDFIIPLYRERRGWDESKIKDFSDNAYKTMDSTRYIVIRDRAGKIRAALGLTTVEYGKVRFFDRKTNAVVELIGSFGSAYRVRNMSINLDQDQIPAPALWQSSVEMLPIETEGFKIPHPGVLEELQLPQDELKRRLKQDDSLRQKGFDPDWDKPVQFFTGRKTEPVKFGVDKNLQDSGLSNVEVLTQMLMSVFPNEMSSEFNKNGQILATYNTADGVRMYGRLGFQRNPDEEPKIFEGQKWFAMTATPQSVLAAINKIQYEKSDEAQKVLEYLNQHFGN